MVYRLQRAQAIATSVSIFVAILSREFGFAESLTLSGSGKYSTMGEDDKNVPRIDRISSVAKTKWLELQTIAYTNQDGKQRNWDVVRRTTKPTSADADAVVIVPLLQKYPFDPNPDTLLVEQFRPQWGNQRSSFLPD